MAKLILPLIAGKEDYDAIRRLPGSNFPQPFERFSYGLSDEARQGAMRGHNVRQIKIDPQKFADWCRDVRRRADIHSLKEFAFEEAKKRPDEEDGIS